MQTKIFGIKIFTYDSVESTNTIASQIAEQGAQEGTVVIAREQTAGKGRLGRKWISCKDKGIYLSLVLRPKFKTDKLGLITLMSAVSIVQSIRKVCKLPALIKWPNDIFIKGKKVCGILSEICIKNNQIEFVVLGIGINVNTEIKDLPKTACSLKSEAGAQVNQSDFLKHLLFDLEIYYFMLKKNKFALIIEQWKRFSLTLGSYVKIQTGSRTIEGKAINIAENGALIVLNQHTGVQEYILSGDLVLIK
ncbi:MAG: biotin--[acetyl-CoA-carboxylase] ligase [Candidatus Omnitrophota bacterium]|nr:MAG: biotin--[acetyl-CoA-carboxylase] ligase [Candidatus Omnitrophota bacterium]